MLGTFIPDFSITAISPDGRAFGMYGEMKVFVEKGVLGDVADIAMIKSWRDNKTTGNGRIISLKKKSPLRIEAFCKHFNYCGGCQWQNISYEDQLKFKQKQVEELIEEFEGFEMLPIIASAQQRRFRNRVSFTFSNRRWMSPEELANPDVLKQPAGGYALKGKNDRVMNIEECFLTNDFAIELMHGLRDEALRRGFSFYDTRYEKGFLRALTVRFGDRGVMVIVVFGENDKAGIDEIMKWIEEKYPQITSLYYVIHSKKRGAIADKPHIHFSGKTVIEYQMEDLIFQVAPNSFYQTNSEQACQLYKTARDFAQLTGKETVYDLYTGAGTIALFVSNLAEKVIGIDSVSEAIEDAKQNARLNGITNVSFFEEDLYNVISLSNLFEASAPDVIISDPPRAGMSRELVKKLNSSGAKRIVYISCNPVTQARDIRQLNTSYELVKSQPVDMFPQTSHLENVTLLVNNHSNDY